MAYTSYSMSEEERRRRAQQRYFAELDNQQQASIAASYAASNTSLDRSPYGRGSFDAGPRVISINGGISKVPTIMPQNANPQYFEGVEESNNPMYYSSVQPNGSQSYFAELQRQKAAMEYASSNHAAVNKLGKAMDEEGGLYEKYLNYFRENPVKGTLVNRSVEFPEGWNRGKNIDVFRRENGIEEDQSLNAAQERGFAQFEIDQMPEGVRNAINEYKRGLSIRNWDNPIENPSEEYKKLMSVSNLPDEEREIIEEEERERQSKPILDKALADLRKELKANGYSEDMAEKLLENARLLSNYENTQQMRQNVRDEVHTGSRAKDLANSMRLTASGVLSAPIQGMLGIAQIIYDKIQGNENVDTYSPLYYAANRSSAIQSEVGNRAAETRLGEAGRLGYSALYGAADSAVRSAAAASAVGLTGITNPDVLRRAGEAVSLGAMAMNVYSTGMQRAQERGLTGIQARETAFAEAAAEVLSELLPTDAAWKAAQGKSRVARSLIINALAQAGLEGLEEGASDVINRIADGIINGDQSEYNQNVKRYQDNGYSLEEAKKAATHDFYKELKEDILVGALSGGVSGGGAAAIGMLNTNVQARQMFDENTDYAEIADSIDTDKENYKNKSAAESAQHAKDLAERLNQKKANGEKISNRELRDLYWSMMDAVETETETRQKDKTAEQNPDETAQDLTNNVQAAPETATNAPENAQIAPETAAAAPENAQPVADQDENVSDGQNTNESKPSTATENIKVPEKYKVPRQTRQETYKKISSAQSIDEMAAVLQEVQETGDQEAIKEAQTYFNVYSGKMAKELDLTDAQINDAKEKPQTRTSAYVAGYKGLQVAGLSPELQEAYNEGKIAAAEGPKTQASEKRMLNNYAANYATAGERRAFLNTYKPGSIVERHKIAFDTTFDAGRQVTQTRKDLSPDEAYQRGWNKLIKDHPEYVRLLGEDTVRNMFDAGIMQSAEDAHTENVRSERAELRKKGTGKFTDFRANPTQDIASRLIDAFASASGLDIELREDLPQKYNGYYDERDSKIVLNAKSGKVMTTLSHEFFEFANRFNTEEFKPIIQDTMTALREILGETGYQNLRSEYTDRYEFEFNSEEGKTLQDLDKEIAADMFMDILADDNGLERLMRAIDQNHTMDDARTIKQRIADFISEIVDKFRDLLYGERLSDAQRKVLDVGLGDMNDLRQRVIDASKKAVENYHEAKIDGFTVETNASPMVASMDVRSSLEYATMPSEETITMKALPFDASVLFTGTDEEIEQYEKAEREAEDKWKGIVEDPSFVALQVNLGRGRVKILSPSVRGGLFQLTNVQDGEPTSHSLYGAGEGHSGDDYWHPMEDLYRELFLMHANKDKKVDVLRNKAATMATDEVLQSLSGIPQKKRFSMDEPIEKTKQFIAIHNLSEEQLAEDLRLGGFPSPSIAIIREGMGHSKYGEVSVILNRDTIDPEVDSRNKVYGGDAYTPVFPTVEREINNELARKIENDFANSARDIAEGTFFDEANNSLGGIGLVYDISTDRTVADIIERLSRNYGVRAAYLQKTKPDAKIEMAYRDREFDRYGNDALQSIIKRIGIKEIDHLVEDEIITNSDRMLDEEDFVKLKELIVEIKSGGDERRARLYNNKTTEVRVADFVWHAYEYAHATEEDKKGLVDKFAIQDQIDKYIDDKKLSEWIDKQINGVLGEPGIYNGKDRFTRSGSRRSFKELHDEYNLENLVKAMNRENAKGADAFVFESLFKAISTKNFKSVDEMRGNIDLLRMESDEEYAAVQRALTDRFNEIVNELVGEEGTYELEEEAENSLVEAARRFNTAAKIESYLKANKDLKVNPGIGKRVKQLMDDIANTPTGYFEAKPQRAIPYTEIAAVIAPEGMNQRTFNLMDDMGINYITYQNGDEAQRQELQNSLPHVRFSMDAADGSAADNVKRSDYSYSTLVAKEDVEVYAPEFFGLTTYEYSNDITREDIIEATRKNIKKYNEKLNRGYGDRALYNKDLGVPVEIGANAIKHRLERFQKGTATEVTSLPASFENAIVINEADSRNKGNEKAYVLIGAYLDDNEIRIVRFIVNRSNGKYKAIEYNDHLYSIKAKKERSFTLNSDRRQNDNVPYHTSFELNVSQLLDAVKNSYPDELSENVANTLGYERRTSEIKGLRYSVEESKDTAGRELTQGQQEYFADSKVRDENGNLKVMYHGTPQGGFTVFKNDLAFFTEDKDYANRYQNASASSRNSRKESSNPQTYEVYLNMKNPFDIRDAAMRRQFINEYVKGGYALGINPYTEYKDVTESGLPSWEEADNIYEWMEENDLLDTYDGILVDEGGVLDDNGGVLHRGVAYITFNSNQIKNVDNQNPTDNPDIRMSVNGEENGFDFDGDNNRVRNEGAKILELGAEALKNQEVDRKTVRKIASDLRAKYGSRYNLTAFTDNMERVFAYAQSGDFVNYRDLMKVLEEVARPVIEEAGELVGQERYDEFMGQMKGYTIALTPNQKKEVISIFGSYQNFRNAMGGIRIANNGTSLDSIWDEICDRVPGLERDTVEGDQPEALYDMLQAMKPTVKNGYGMDMEEAARDLSLQIVEKYYEEAGKKNSKVAAAAEQMKKQNEEYRKDLKETYLKRFNEAKQAMGAHYDKETAQLRARLKKRAQDAKTRREQADQVRVIRKEAGELLNWAANPNKEHHVMNSMLEPVMDLLSALDFATPRVERTTVGYQARVWDPSLHRFQTIDGNTYTEVMEKVEQAIQQGGGSAAQRKWADRMSSIRDIFDKVRNNDSFEQRDRDDFLRTINPELADQLKDVIDRNKDVVQLSDLGVEDLKVIKNVIKNVKHAVSVENKAFTNNVDLTNIAQGILKESEDTKNLRADRSKAGNFAIDNVIIANMTPDTYFDVIHAGEVNKILRSAAEKKMANIRKIVDAKDKIFAGIDQKDIQKWDSPKSLKTYKVADGTLQMTDAQVMYLYEMNKRQQAKLHQPGGITIEKMEMSSGPFAKQKAQSKAVHLSEAEIKKITDTLTTQQKELADRMQVFLADDCAKMGNEATLKMYGYEVFGDPNYMPLRSDQNVISMQSRENVGVTNAIANMGFTKQVNLNARNALVVSSIFDIFTKHTADMATYNAYAPAIADALRIYNYKDVYTENGSDTAYTVQYAIQQMLGDKGKEYFEKLIKDINARERSDYIPSLTDALTSNYKVAAIAGNIRVVVQQPTAIMRAGMLINPKYLLKGLSSVTNINKTKERMLNTSELAWWKSQGYYETNIGPSMKALITGEQSTKEKIQEKALAAAGAADDITWSVIFSAVEDEVSDQFKAKGKSTKTEEYKQAVKERFHDILWQTQVFDATLGRSEYMRSSDRRNIMAASFMAEPTKTFNMMLKPWYQAIRSAEGTGAKKIVSAAASKGVTKSAYYFVMTSALTAAATAFIDAFRRAGKADEEDEYGKRYANAFRENFIDNVNPLKLLPIIKDLYELLESGYKALVKGENTLGSSSSTNMEFEALNNAISAMMDINKYREGEGTKTLYGVINSTIRALSQLTGVPVYNINRDVTAVYNTAREKFTDLPDLFETSTTNRKTKAKNGVFKAIEEGGDYKKAIRESVEAGNRLDTMASTITSEYKEQYVELMKTNPSEAKKLENRLEAIYKYLAQVNKTEYKPRVKDWPKDVEKAEKNKEKKQANQESFLNN